MGAIPEITSIDELVNRRLEELLPQKIEQALREREESKTPSMVFHCLFLFLRPDLSFL